MIRGYGVYIGTDLATGMMYAGSVHSGKTNWTPEKGFKKRIKKHKKEGKIGFAWLLLRSESREGAGLSHISERLYPIRIAVDEDRAVQNIPHDRRLNKISPLLQVDALARNEEIGRMGGRISGATTGRKNAENGHLSRIRSLAAGIGITASSLLRRGWRRGKPDGGGAANAAHVAAFVESADSRS